MYVITYILYITVIHDMCVYIYIYIYIINSYNSCIAIEINTFM